MLGSVSALPVGTVPGPEENKSVNPDSIQFSVIPVEPSPEGFVPGPAIHFQSRQKRTLFFTHQVLAFHLGLMVLQCHIHRFL